MANAPIFPQPILTQPFLFPADDFRRFRAGGRPGLDRDFYPLPSIRSDRRSALRD